MKPFLFFLMITFGLLSQADMGKTEFFQKIERDVFEKFICQLETVDSRIGLFGTLTCDGVRLTSEKILPPADEATLLTGSVKAIVWSGFRVLSCESAERPTLSGGTEPVRRCLFITRGAASL